MPLKIEAPAFPALKAPIPEGLGALAVRERKGLDPGHGSRLESRGPYWDEEDVVEVVTCLAAAYKHRNQSSEMGWARLRAIEVLGSVSISVRQTVHPLSVVPVVGFPGGGLLELAPSLS